MRDDDRGDTNPRLWVTTIIINQHTRLGYTATPSTPQPLNAGTRNNFNKATTPINLHDTLGTRPSMINDHAKVKNRFNFSSTTNSLFHPKTRRSLQDTCNAHKHGNLQLSRKLMQISVLSKDVTNTHPNEEVNQIIRDPKRTSTKLIINEYVKWPTTSPTLFSSHMLIFISFYHRFYIYFSFIIFHHMRSLFHLLVPCLFPFMFPLFSSVMAHLPDTSLSLSR